MTPDDPKTRIQLAHELIEAIPEDRLDTLGKSLGIRQVILNCLGSLNDISDVSASEKFTDHDLTVIRGHFAESARPLVELMEYFVDQAEKDYPKTLAV